jgi:hypothetical protein
VLSGLGACRPVATSSICTGMNDMGEKAMLERKAIRGAVLFLALLASGCELLSQNVRVVPDSARECVAGAEEERLRCRERLFPQYQQCTYNQQMLDNQKQMSLQQDLQYAQERFDRCVGNCVRRNKNERWMCEASMQFCGDLKDKVKSLEDQKNAALRHGSQDPCNRTYAICEEAFESRFRQCGGYWEKR